MPNIGAEAYRLSFFSGLKPDPVLTVSEWADAFRMLPQEASAEPGRWRTDRTPYLREIMDCLSATSPVSRVVFMKGAQVGGTEAGNNWLGYVIDHAPAPFMVVQANIELAKKTSKLRIDPLIASTPQLRAKVADARSRDSSNTILQKDFPGGVLILTGANSPVGLRSTAARYLFLDEVDAYPGDVGGEGDPVGLAEARTRTFARRKILEVSTPTIEGRSRIARSFDKSDQRYYHVPCPDCGHKQRLRWSGVKKHTVEGRDGRKDLVAEYACEACGVLIPEHKKTWMLAHGEWVASKPGARRRGYHLNSLYSPVGWFSWRDAVEKWEEAQENPDELKVFVNTVLGETWKDSVEVPKWEALYNRREHYPMREVQTGGLILTAGADVQKDRIEVEVVAWGRNLESWSVDYQVFPGDTAGELVWQNLALLLQQTFTHVSGVPLRIGMLAVDSGYNTQHVYNWVRQQPPDRVLAVKGRDTLQVVAGSPQISDVNWNGRKIARGVRVWPVGVSQIKSELYGWLRQEKPTDESKGFPPGYCHFPEYPEDYFKQMTGEQLVVRMVRGNFRRYEWEKTRERNEALDARVYARAAAFVLGVDRYTPEQWASLEQVLGISGPKDGSSHEPMTRRIKRDYFDRWRTP